MTLPAALAVAIVLTGSDGPLLYEVPRGGPRLADQRPALFFAAPFRVERGRVVRGEWRASDEILGPGATRVVVVASWCPACKHLLSRLARDRSRAPVILFLEDERAKREGRDAPNAGDELADAGSLEGFPRRLWLLRTPSPLASLVTHYPFDLVCRRDACRPARAAGR